MHLGTSVCLEKTDTPGCNLVCSFPRYLSPSLPTRGYVFGDMEPGVTRHSKYLEAGHCGHQCPSCARVRLRAPGCSPFCRFSALLVFVSLLGHFCAPSTHSVNLMKELLEAGVPDGKGGSLF